ncbi:unnamed protein product [Brassica rapa]|uniref:Polycomb protein VEFS-Box domain-containing protein n=1 Tax=Brassica campestris TaxID=3711 RepID=A0A8D9GGM6_BRACM|nr:unnamed protein product [Brassica rapa]
MIDQTHMEYFREHMSDEEKIAAQESLKATYGPPIEFYTFFRRRAIKNPLFLQRSLKYKTEAKRQRSKDAAGVETQELFPLFIMLARLVSSKTTAKVGSSSAIYKFSRACILTGDDGVSQPQANFLLPRMDRLALDAKSGSLVILFISFAGAQNSQSGIDSSKIHSGNIGGHCLWSKIPLESLYSSWKEYPNMDLGEKATSVSLVEMQPCFLQLMSMSEKFVEIQVPSNPLTSSSPQQVQVTISAQEVGATENPPYRSSFSFSDFPASSVVLPIHRLRKGQVAFNYSYYNNKLQKTEVTGDFTCPLCKVKCASFKGLECHIATHDFFNFEFWVNEKYPAVNVSLNEVTLTETSKCFKKEKKGDPNARLEPYPFSSMKSSRRKQKTPARNPWPRPIKTDDAADSVKSEKSQIPPGGAESSSQTVPPGMGPADLQMMNMWNSFMKKHRVITGGCIACGCEAFSKLHGPFLVRNLDLLCCSRWIDQMHNEYFCAHMSEEEKIAAEESFKAYINPTELYMKLQDRAKKNPLFLQRSLSYKIEAKHQRRIQMTVSLSDTIETQKLFPLYVFLARLVSPDPTAEYSAVYKFSRTCSIPGGVDGKANFLLPEMDRLALKAGSVDLLFISFAGEQNFDSSKIRSGNIGGHCFLSKIPLETLYSSWKKYPNMGLGERATSVSLVEMQPYFLQLKCIMSEQCVEIQVPRNPLTSSSPQQVQVTISAQEVGATENPPYRSSFSFNDFPASSGLECHMPSTHDLFNFEFWVNEKYPAVNVSLKSEVTFTEVNAADSVKCEKSQTVPPGMGPADLQMMNMWNSFMKKHRVITGGCIACGCEAFSKLHGPFLVRNLDLLWCWKKYIWTLKIYGRLDAQTLNNCMVLFEQLAN